MSLARYRQLLQRIIEDQEKKTSTSVLLSYLAKIARVSVTSVISRDWEKVKTSLINFFHGYIDWSWKQNEDSNANNGIGILIKNFEEIKVWIGINSEKAGGQFELHLWFFQKCVFQRKREALFFVTFNTIISHIFPENFTKNAQLVQKIWRFSSSKLAIFINFDISLLQRN